MTAQDEPQRVVRASERRRRSVSGRGQPTHLVQLPWRRVTNPYPKYEIYSADQIEAIHNTSMRILEELGIELMSASACARMTKAGAQVDRSTMNVRMDRGLVAELVAKAPPTFTIVPRNPEHAVHFGGNDVIFGLVAGPPNVHDRERGRRSGNLNDYRDFIRLAHYFNAIHIIGNQVVAPVELQANTRHLDTYLTNLVYSDLSFHCTSIGRGRATDGARMMAISRGSTMEELAKVPGVTTIISVNSPRRFDEAMADGLTAMAEMRQPICVTPFTLLGAMTPVTLPAALAQQNAEALFGIALAQIISPGTPMVYGSFTSNVDMKSGAPAFGTPENTKANIVSGQLARRYKLPYRTSNPTASNAADAQSVYETEMSLWGSILGGSNLVYHAAGWLEGGLTASYEKLILDIEMLQNMMEFLRPDEVNDETLGFEAIRRVPTGGHFFGDPHTLERYERAFYQPLLSDWRQYENWADAGAVDASARATEIWKRALKEYVEPPMDKAIRDELDAYVAKRREEIGSGEP
ncbi:MAG: trimethylamine methyltransferase family protein [Alphaproteobacteria bacterium]|nr:trimethylamine methyltransferase family protein [Alphaproteobacteria bacterium]